MQHHRRSANRARPSRRRRSHSTRYWSRDVTEHSDALDIEPSAFRGTARQIASSLKRSADRSKRRKSTPFRSAMSMLTFYANRAGKNLPESRKRTLERAKAELRKLYDRPTK